VTSTPEAPPPRVLAAFGLVGGPERLAGGQGTSWRVGQIVLKPGVDPRHQEWLGTVVARLKQRGFRLPTVRRAEDGAWVVLGWGAQSFLPGSTVLQGMADWGSIIGASRALHAATAALERPEFLDHRRDPWARADRDAWADSPRPIAPELRGLVERLKTVPPPTGRAQLVHGDLTSNVLMQPDELPSVIDFSPYWRPPSYAEGIVVADALCWHAAPLGIVDELRVPIEAVARGLLFRALTSGYLHRPGSAALEADARRYRSVTTALGL
jgi:uncharacterized protein (TIGR02569 family)